MSETTVKHEYDRELGKITEQDREYAGELLMEWDCLFTKNPTCSTDELDNEAIENTARWLRKVRYEAVLSDRLRSISREATLVARIRAIELTVDGLNTKGFQQKAETQSALDRIKAHCRDAINSKPARNPTKRTSLPPRNNNMGWLTITSSDPTYAAKLQALLDEGKTTTELELERKQGRPDPQADGDWDARQGEANK